MNSLAQQKQWNHSSDVEPRSQSMSARQTNKEWKPQGSASLCTELNVDPASQMKSFPACWAKKVELWGCKLVPTALPESRGVCLTHRGYRGGVPPRPLPPSLRTPPALLHPPGALLPPRYHGGWMLAASPKSLTPQKTPSPSRRGGSAAGRSEPRGGSSSANFLSALPSGLSLASLLLSAPRWRWPGGRGPERGSRIPPGPCPVIAAAPRATSRPSPPPGGAACSGPTWAAQVRGCRGRGSWGRQRTGCPDPQRGGRPGPLLLLLVLAMWGWKLAL